MSHPARAPARSASRLARAVAAIAQASARRPLLTLAAWLLLAAIAVTHLALHFSIDTDTAKLVRPDLPWRQREIAFDRLFPQRTDLIVAVIDGSTPEAAEAAAAALYARAASRSDLFRSVRRPDGGPFFDRNGLLFLSPEALSATLEQLIAAQPLLGSLAQDPSLRGIVHTLVQFTQGVALSPSEEATAQLTAALGTVATTLEAARAGAARPLPWSALMAGGGAAQPASRDATGSGEHKPAPDAKARGGSDFASGKNSRGDSDRKATTASTSAQEAKPAGNDPTKRRELRRFVLAQPVLHYDSLLAGKKAVDALRLIGAELGFTPERGVTMRLTGPVPLADEELATLEQGGLASGAITLSLLVVLLAIAVRSAALVAAILASLVLALAVTAGLGLAVVGSFNLISVAFAVLCVGLGVDFGIQMGIAYRAQREPGMAVSAALGRAGTAVGGALAIAACATAAGFFSFLPTDYRGVSELGLVAGVGMLIAFAASITVLPALIALFAISRAREPLGFASLAPLDRALRRRRGAVLAVTLVLAAASLALLPRARFDADPLHLRSPATESVATVMDLARDPLTSPDSIDVLARTEAAARELAGRLSALPQVAQVLSLDSFVPEDQDAKLALISDAASLMLPMFDAPPAAQPPADGEDASAMRSAAATLRAATISDAALRAATQRLAGDFDALGAQDATAARERARAALVPGLQGVLRQMREALQAARVTRETLPADLVADWIAADGRVRIEAFPSGTPGDERARAAFVDAVTAVAQDATGPPISIAAWGATIVHAFLVAGLLACAAVAVLLALVLRRAVDVLLAIGVLLLSGLFTMALCVAIDQPLNFENIIALPLLFGVGVAFNVYFMIAWRNGERALLQTSLARAVIFSALTTASAFGSLWLSEHPGTASMGKLLVLSLGCTLACTLLVLPALLAWRSRDEPAN